MCDDVSLQFDDRFGVSTREHMFAYCGKVGSMWSWYLDYCLALFSIRFTRRSKSYSMLSCGRYTEWLSCRMQSTIIGTNRYGKLCAIYGTNCQMQSHRHWYISLTVFVWSYRKTHYLFRKAARSTETFRIVVDQHDVGATYLGYSIANAESRSLRRRVDTRIWSSSYAGKWIYI